MCECMKAVTSFLAEYFCSMPAMIPASDSLRIADSSLAVTTGLELVSFEFRSAVATMVELVLMARLLCSAAASSEAVQEMTGAERAKPEEDESESECSWRKREARRVRGKL